MLEAAHVAPVLSAPPVDVPVTVPPNPRARSRWPLVAGGMAVLGALAAVTAASRPSAPGPRPAHAGVHAAEPAAPVLAPSRAGLSDATRASEARDTEVAAVPASATTASEATRAAPVLPAGSEVDGQSAQAATSAAALGALVDAPARRGPTGDVGAVPAEKDTPADPPFDARAAGAAIDAAFARARNCRQPEEAGGLVTVHLRYAPSGRVTNATVSGSFAGTKTGGCIAATLRTARVPPFSGDYLTVKRSATID